MPELPEVEVVRKTLKEQLVGLKIIQVVINYKNIIENEEAYFINNVINKEIIDVLRLGKLLIFKLNEGFFVSHLKMEGKYFIKDSNESYNKHEHVIFKLSNKFDLRYHDVRKFGRIEYKTIDNLYTTNPIKNIGFEVFDERLTPSYLLNKSSTKCIKTFLLDQSIMSGLGNIYVDEVLFKSKIHPESISNNLSLEDFDNIISYSREILKKSISEGGTTIRSYTSSLNKTGNYQKFLLVHTKNNNPCSVCSTSIVKIRVNGRGTYLCPKCQIKK